MNTIINTILLSILLTNITFATTTYTINPETLEETFNLEIESVEIEGLKKTEQKLQDVEEILKHIALMQIQLIEDNQKQTNTKKIKTFKKILINTAQMITPSIIAGCAIYFFSKYFQTPNICQVDEIIETAPVAEMVETIKIPFLLRTDISLINPWTWPCFK